jgi:hypothetical protein
MNDNNSYSIGQHITVQVVDRPYVHLQGRVVGIVVRFNQPYTQTTNISWYDNGGSTFIHGIIGERPNESIPVQKVKTD